MKKEEEKEKKFNNALERSSLRPIQRRALVEMRRELLQFRPNAFLLERMMCDFASEEEGRVLWLENSEGGVF